MMSPSFYMQNSSSSLPRRIEFDFQSEGGISTVESSYRSFIEDPSLSAREGGFWRVKEWSVTDQDGPRPQLLLNPEVILMCGKCGQVFTSVTDQVGFSDVHDGHCGGHVY